MTKVGRTFGTTQHRHNIDTTLQCMQRIRKIVHARKCEKRLFKIQTLECANPSERQVKPGVGCMQSTNCAKPQKGKDNVQYNGKVVCSELAYLTAMKATMKDNVHIIAFTS